MEKEKTKNIKVKEVVEINKEEINDYIDEQVKKYFSYEIDKTNKKLIRYKNRKLFWKDITILILIAIIIYLLYTLYTLNYFDKFINIGGKVKTEEKVVSKKEEKKKLSLDELKEKYSSYLDNIRISESSSYLESFYEGKLTDELKLYLVLNNINFDKISKENDYNIIDEELIKKEYNKLFDSEYKGVSFYYNDIEVRYISKMKSYITDDILEKDISNIKREITDIKLNGDEVVITTIEGIIKDNTLYDKDNNEVDDFNEENSLLDYEDELEKIEYVFVNKKLKEIR